MDVESRLDLIKEVGEEILTEQELRELLAPKKNGNTCHCQHLSFTLL